MQLEANNGSKAIRSLCSILPSIPTANADLQLLIDFDLCDPDNIENHTYDFNTFSLNGYID